MFPMRLIPITLLVLLLLPAPLPARAQTQCGFADTFDFPLDPAAFTVTQDFGTPSSRHQGRFHTGEDWYAGRGATFGAPVRAIGTGRVTFSSPNGWGMDGGVIIIEHTLRDNTTLYSMYGHLTDQTGIHFPPLFSCVRIGDVLAAIGDARPAPHLHFEMRINQPDIPGAGYTFEDPVALGFRRPGKTILNIRARGVDGFRFAADLADETGALAPPVILRDDGLMLLDADRVIGLSRDGRVLWRTVLERRAVALLPSGADAALIVYTDGGVQPIEPGGARGTARTTGTAFDSAPTIGGGRLVFPTPDGGLAAFDPAMTAPLWVRAGLGRAVRLAVTPLLVGMIIEDGRILTLNAATGETIDTAMLREPGAIAPGRAGDLLVYTRGGLWSINSAGRWTLRQPDAPPGGAAAALLEMPDGALYTFDGSVLRAYTPALVWEVALPPITGQVALAAFPVDPARPESRIVLLTSGAGDIIAVRATDGGVCNRARVYGDARSATWAGVGADGVLRLHTADRVTGYTWRAFLGACGV
jgi:murein DD-endopeptidase MepM/ murein hydrolase activator NlpD